MSVSSHVAGNAKYPEFNTQCLSAVQACVEAPRTIEQTDLPYSQHSYSSTWHSDLVSDGANAAHATGSLLDPLAQGWSPLVADKFQWLQLNCTDVGASATHTAEVSGVAIRGRRDYAQWVAMLKISCPTSRHSPCGVCHASEGSLLMLLMMGFKRVQFHARGSDRFPGTAMEYALPMPARGPALTPFRQTPGYTITGCPLTIVVEPVDCPPQSRPLIHWFAHSATGSCTQCARSGEAAWPQLIPPGCAGSWIARWSWSDRAAGGQPAACRGGGSASDDLGRAHRRGGTRRGR
jgi:hypothetical protein